MNQPLRNLMQSEFYLASDIIYLNHAAIAPWPNRSAEAVKNFAQENSLLGSKNYLRWIEVESELRKMMCHLINAPSHDDIALLKNTSEALSVVAFGLDWHDGDNIVTTDQEFPSNRVVWQALNDQGVELRQASLHSKHSSNNHSPEEAIFSQTDENTRLITVSSIQYGSGFQLNLEKIGQFCSDHNILFCVDAIQSIGAIQFDTQAIRADFVMADGHKWMLGPEGVALFYCRAELRDKLRLFQYGWHMTDAFVDFNKQDWKPADSAKRFECGSPNMLGIHALSASLSLLLEFGMDNVEKNVLDNTQTLFNEIKARPELELLTDNTPGRYGGIVTFRHRSLSNEELFNHLTESGVMCAQRGGGIRFSPHFYTPKEKIHQAVEIAATAK
jgi:selenocysteine lyase/cysteine desulfurase